MEQEYLKQQQLLERYNSGLCSPEEIRMVNYWYNLQAESAADQFEDPDYTQLRNEIWAKLPAAMEPVSAGKAHVVKLNGFKWAAVAAVILMVMGGGLFFLSKKPSQDQAVFANDVGPGSNKAVLTLANGKTIALSDTKTGVVINASELKYNDGTNITSVTSLRGGTTKQSSLNKEIASSRNASRNDVNIVSTPRGGQYQVVLSDGTSVWLNAASKLQFPAKFIGSQRSVTLVGEGYFEVIPNKAKPFIVKTANQQVEVLGTHFNINSYADEPAVTTTLLEGSVKVKRLKNGLAVAGDHAAVVVLKPGQLSLLQAKELDVQTADINKEMAWKKGDFVFNNEDFNSILRQVSRWYDVEIINNGKYSDLRLTGTVSRSRNISTVLKALMVTGKVIFKVEGRRVTVVE